MNFAALDITVWPRVSKSFLKSSSTRCRRAIGGSVERNRLLPLVHMWAAFITFLPAVGLGVWQMLMRSSLPAPVDDPNMYYASVTAHGTIMAYVFPTLFAMGFGYAIANSARNGALAGKKIAWTGFFLLITGLIMAVIPIIYGTSSVLYTFYPTLIGSPWYYLGVVMILLGSWFWMAVMVLNFRGWKRDNPGQTVPLSLFAITACALLWGWTTLGVTTEILFQILPVAFGWRHSIDAGLARTLFSLTLHAIVYFWLIPSYIAYYTLMPQAAGGRLYSDTMGRITFVLFLVFSIPVGLHISSWTPSMDRVSSSFNRHLLLWLHCPPYSQCLQSRLHWKWRGGCAEVKGYSVGFGRCRGMSPWFSPSVSHCFFWVPAVSVDSSI